MGSYDNVQGIVNEVLKLRAFGMEDDEIEITLQDDGVEPAYVKTAFNRSRSN